MMPKRKLINRKISFSCTYSTVEEVIKWFEKTKAELPKDSYKGSEFTIDEEYDCQYVYLSIYYNTEQTDEEIALEKQRTERTLAYKREQLRKLKEELGDV